MTIRAPVKPPERGWRMRLDEVEANPEFQAECLRLWDRKYNTCEIARLMFQPEYAVEKALRIARERRRREQET